VVGTRNALSGGGTAGAGRQASTLGGSVVAVAAMVAAVGPLTWARSEGLEPPTF
jgi:hypothetical protein